MALFCSIGSASVLSILVPAEHRTKEFSRKLIKRVKSNLNDEKKSISTSFVEENKNSCLRRNGLT